MSRICICTVLLLVGCSHDPSFDAGGAQDSMVADSGVDAVVLDASPDTASADAGADGGTDSAVDSGSDAALMDAESDTGSPDAGPVDSGVVDAPTPDAGTFYVITAGCSGDTCSGMVWCPGDACTFDDTDSPCTISCLVGSEMMVECETPFEGWTTVRIRIDGVTCRVSALSAMCAEVVASDVTIACTIHPFP